MRVWTNERCDLCEVLLCLLDLSKISALVKSKLLPFMLSSLQLASRMLLEYTQRTCLLFPYLVEDLLWIDL